jgi:hypothetical protein
MEGLRHLLAWCLVINYTVLIVWCVATIIGHDWIARMHGKLFRLPIEKFSSINYLGIAFFKIGILLFNLTPYLALRIMA